MTMIRQGDVLLRRITKLPETAKPGLRVGEVGR